MDKKKPSVSSRFTQPYVVWPIIAALVCVIGLLAAYTVMLRGELSRREAKTQNTTVTPMPSPAQVSTVPPRPTEKAGTDINNVYTNTKVFAYSFEHLDGYKVVEHAGERFSIRKLLADGKTELSHKNPNNLGVSIENYYSDGVSGVKTKNKPYTREEIIAWIDQRARGAQCFNGVTVTYKVKENIPLYEAVVTCGAGYEYQYLHFVELHKRQGDFLIISSFDSEQSEQIPLLLRTFSLINQ